MATATITTDFTTLNNCDATTGWTGIIPTSETGFHVEGSACCAFLKKTTGLTTTTYAISSTDLSNTHVRMWFNSILKTRLDTFANGGLQIVMSDGTNTGNWYVSGGDKYSGGWDILAIDTSKAPDSGTQPTMTAITSVGIGLNLASAAVGTVPTFWIDYMHYGKGYYLSGGTSGDEIGLAEIDTSDVYYGIIKKLWGVYYFNGELQIGDNTGTATTYFKDAGQMFVFLDEVVNSSLYLIKVIGNSTGTTIIDFSGNFITSVSDNLEIDFSDATNVTSITIDGTLLQNVTTFTGSSIVSGDGTVFDGCGMLDVGSSSLSNFTIKNSTALAALDFPSTNNLDTCAFISSGTGHAIQLTSTGTITLANFTYNGYASSDGTTGNECIYNNSGGAVTINISGGDTPTIRNGTGASTTLVVNPVDTTVIAKTSEASPSAIENAMVLVLASTGGDYPYDETVTISNSGTTATVTHTAHGMTTSDKIQILGASYEENNGVFQIVSVTDANTYTYTMSSTPAGSPTGTIKSTWVALNGLTNVSGEITMNRSFNNDQPITGRVRKSTSSPFYKTSNFVGTIYKTSGFSMTAQLISDE